MIILLNITLCKTMPVRWWWWWWYISNEMKSLIFLFSFTITPLLIFPLFSFQYIFQHNRIRMLFYYFIFFLNKKILINNKSIGNQHLNCNCSRYWCSRNWKNIYYMYNSHDIRIPNAFVCLFICLLNVCICNFKIIIKIIVKQKHKAISLIG
jgi:hypothetical protein